MAGKKDKNRFTLQFDPDDERHQKAVRILNHQGRKKANYIANLIFANCNDDGSLSEKNTLLSPSLSLTALISNKETEPQKNNILLSIDDDEMDEGEMALIRKSADAFIK